MKKHGKWTDPLFAFAALNQIDPERCCTESVANVADVFLLESAFDTASNDSLMQKKNTTPPINFARNENIISDPKKPKTRIPRALVKAFNVLTVPSPVFGGLGGRFCI
jgi:hypothetical protein